MSCGEVVKPRHYARFVEWMNTYDGMRKANTGKACKYGTRGENG
jgi:hypothetical protein